LIPGDVQRYGFALAIDVDALNGDVAKRSCSGKAAAVFDNCRECRFARSELINSRAFHGARNGDLWTRGRNKQSVSTLKPGTLAVISMQQEVVQVDVFNELLPAIVPKSAQGANRCGPSSGIQSAHRRCEGGDVIAAWTLDVSDDIHAYRTHM
jgi:hypothetical protein